MGRRLKVRGLIRKLSKFNPDFYVYIHDFRVEPGHSQMSFVMDNNVHEEPWKDGDDKADCVIIYVP